MDSRDQDIDNKISQPFRARTFIDPRNKKSPSELHFRKEEQTKHIYDIYICDKSKNAGKFC